MKSSEQIYMFSGCQVPFPTVYGQEAVQRSSQNCYYHCKGGTEFRYLGPAFYVFIDHILFDFINNPSVGAQGILQAYIIGISLR